MMLSRSNGWLGALRAVAWATGVAALAIGALPGQAVTATQDATPSGALAGGIEVLLMTVDGEQVGTAVVSEADGSVSIALEATGLTPGPHGFHLHAVGLCEPEGEQPFASAGGHFNPTDAMHGAGPDTAGTPVAAGAHAGDLGNIEVGDDGTVSVTIVTDRVTLAAGETSLADADGTALVIHAGEDDLTTDPSGESGPRLACGVVFAPEGGTPVATPSS